MKPLLRILILSAPWLAACGKPDIREASAAYGKEPFLQSAEQGCLRVSGLYVPQRSKAIREILEKDSLAKMGSPEVEQALAEAGGDGKTWEFRLKVEPAPSCRDTLNFHASDVVYGQARGQEGIDKAIQAFQEGLANRLWLKAGGTRVKPKLCHVESILGMDNSRQVWVIFRLEDSDKEFLSKAANVELAADNVVPGQGMFILSWPSKVFANGA